MVNTYQGTHNPGIQTFGGNLTYSGGSAVVNWELAGNTSTNAPNPNALFDQIIVEGNLDFTNLTNLNLSFNNAGSSVHWNDLFWSSNQSWTLYSVTGTTSNLSNLILGIIDWQDSGGIAFSDYLDGGTFSLSQSSNDVILEFTAAPEPSRLLLVFLGFLGLGLRRRRK